MTKRLYRVLAQFLRAVATASEPLDVGLFGPNTKYGPRESKQIGPKVKELARDGIIVPGHAHNSPRVTRNKTLTNQWLSGCSAACLRTADEFDRRADAMTDDDGPPDAERRQLLLFD